jgi:hypothetical protein
LARYSYAVMVILITLRRGDASAKRGGASEQKCTLHTGCIERCPSEIAPRWAPLSFWRGRPGARRVAKPTGETVKVVVEEGEKAYLKWLAEMHPAQFAPLYGRLVPFELQANVKRMNA